MNCKQLSSKIHIITFLSLVKYRYVSYITIVLFRSSQETHAVSWIGLECTYVRSKEQECNEQATMNRLILFESNLCSLSLYLLYISIALTTRRI